MSEPTGPAADTWILDRLRAVYQRIDPPPAELDERVLFAIALDNVDVEVTRLQQELLAGSGPRSTERSRTVTFDSQSLTIMISIVDRPDSLVRVDGWLAPAGPMRVELRLAERTGSVVRADDTGRFVFDGVARGLAQLIVHPVEGASRTVVTPALTL
jgi:hypothetical protein